VVVVGCGALGSTLAEMMVRAGVKRLVVVDRDYVEESNLQRQSLFEETDAAQGLPKAVAAEARLRRINSEVEVRGVVADLAADTVDDLLKGADLVLDGTDNFEARFLVNDVCVREGIPWVYGACVGAYGLALLVRPRVSPCLALRARGDAAARLRAHLRHGRCRGPHRPRGGRPPGRRGAEDAGGRTESLLPGVVTWTCGRASSR
jgi:molybdopterin/thiamine biosynthesis adenylyltransferase